MDRQPLPLLSLSEGAARDRQRPEGYGNDRSTVPPARSTVPRQVAAPITKQPRPHKTKPPLPSSEVGYCSYRTPRKITVSTVPLPYPVAEAQGVTGRRGAEQVSRRWHERRGGFKGEAAVCGEEAVSSEGEGHRLDEVTGELPPLSPHLGYGRVGHVQLKKPPSQRPTATIK